MIKRAFWEGRYQPIHIGHIAYMKKMLESYEELWIVVLQNETSDIMELNGNRLVCENFTKAVDPHHRSEKNPFPLYLRLKMVSEVIKTEFKNKKVFVTAGHRMDLDPKFYFDFNGCLPLDAVALTPNRDNYEDCKAEFWKKMGRKVVRIDVSELPEVSATLVRKAMEQNDEVKLQELLHPSTLQILKEHR